MLFISELCTVLCLHVFQKERIYACRAKENLFPAVMSVGHRAEVVK